MPLVAPNLDTRTFEEILTEVRRRIPTFTPEWTDLNESDPGIVLAELFAFMSEQLLFQVNQVPDKGLITFLKLVGEDAHAATPAIADVTFTPIGFPIGVITVLDAAAEVATAAPPAGSKEAITFETTDALPILNGSLEELGSLDCNGVPTVHTASNDSPTATYKPFGNATSIRDSFFLCFKLPGTTPSWPIGTFRLRVNIAGSFDVGDPTDDPGPSVPPRIEWAYAIANTDDAAGKGLAFSTSFPPLLDSTLEFTRSGYLEFDFDAATAAKFVQAYNDRDIEFMRGLFVLRARILRPDAYDAPPTLNTIRLNTVPATATQTIPDERLGGSTGLPFQRFRLANAPVIPGSVEIVVDPSPDVWTEVDDIFDSGPDDRVFELLPATGEVLFGDGKHGRIPAPDDGSVTGGNLRATTYRFGGGLTGNVGAGTLTQVTALLPLSATLDATNVLPARGGDDEETVTEAVARAPAVVRSRYRAVSAADFEALAKETPGVRVARARAVANTRPGRQPGTSPGCVTVVLVPHVAFEDSIDAPITVPDFISRAVLAYLDPRRLVTTNVFTASAVFRKVTIDATVQADPKAIPTEVRGQVLFAVETYLHALVGGDEGTGWPFGGTIYFSNVFQRILAAPGVLRVETLLIALDDGPFVECADIPICDGELLYSGDHVVTVKTAT